MCRVLVSNPYVFNKQGARLADWLDEREFDVAFLNEMHKLHDDVRRLGYLYSGDGDDDSRNNVVLTRREARGLKVVKLCSRVGNSKVWHDRYAVRVVLDGVAYYCVHANATIQDPDTGGWRDNVGARRWEHGTDALVKMMQADLDDGLDLVFGGDMNWRDSRNRGRLLHGTPEWICQTLGLKYVTTQVMWLAYSPGIRLADWKRLPTPPGADGHPVILADLRREAIQPETRELIRDGHQSGHVTAPEVDWKTAIGAVTRRCSVAGITEAKLLTNGEDILRKTWQVHRGTDESEVIWDGKVWAHEGSGVEKIPTPTWRRGTRVMDHFELTWALLSHRESGFTYLRVAGHLPAHLHRPAQRKAHDFALAGLAAAVARMPKADETTLSFDFNLDLRVKGNRDRVRAALPGYRLVVPPAATFRGRIIDGHLTTMRVEDRDMLPRQPNFDHRGSRAVLVAGEPADPEPAEAHENSEEGSMVKIADFIEAPNSGGDYDKNLLVVHVTISPEVKGAARGVIRFWQRGRTGSTQYVVDANEIVQAVRERAYAWAAGTHANKRGIHVELCGFLQSVRQWRDGYSTAELDLAARLFAELATKYGIPIRKIGPAQIRKAYETGRPEDGGICGHVDISHTWPADTSHTDPGRYFPWARFLDLVKKYADNPRAKAPADEKDWFDMATKDDLREVVREELDRLLDDDMNKHEPKGATRFRGMTLRELLKQVHSAVVKG